MPDGVFGLYPQAQPNPLGNPLNVIGLARGIQEYQIRQAQQPALEQIPQAELQGIQLNQNIAAQNYARQSIANGVLALGRDPTENDVHSLVANTATAVGPQFAPMVGDLGNWIINNKGGSIVDNARTVLGMAQAPGARTDVYDPTLGTTVSQPAAAVAGRPAIGGMPYDQKAFIADSARSGDILNNLRPLQAAFPLIEQLSHQDFGTASNAYSQLRSLMITAGVLPADAASTSQSLREAANKYLHNYLSGAPGAQRSDAGLMEASKGRPSFDLTQPANVAVIKKQIAMDRMDAARPQIFQAETGAGPAATGYVNYSARYPLEHSVDAFKSDLMSPAERAAANKLPPAEKAAFWKTKQLAKQLQFLGPTIAPAGQ